MRLLEMAIPGATALALGLIGAGMASAARSMPPNASSTFAAQAQLLRAHAASLAQEAARQEQALAALIEEAARSDAAIAAAAQALAMAETALASARAARGREESALTELIAAGLLAGDAPVGFAPAVAGQQADAAAMRLRRARAAQAEADTALLDARNGLGDTLNARPSGAADLAARPQQIAALRSASERLLARSARLEARAFRLSASPPAGPHAPLTARALFGPAGAQTLLPFGVDGPGLVFTAAPGQTVRAPAAGRVVYASAFRDYGEVLILELAQSSAIVLAGLGETQARLGDQVSAGAVLGRMGADAPVAPELYVEVRASGRPIDPERAARSWP